MHFRLNSYPSMSVDPVSGVISLAWADQQGSGTCGHGGSSFTGTTSNQVKLDPRSLGVDRLGEPSCM